MQKRTSISSPLLQVTAMLSGRKLAFAAMKACSMSLGERCNCSLRRLQHRGDGEPLAHAAHGGEIVVRAEACAGSVLAIFVGRETCRSGRGHARRPVRRAWRPGPGRLRGSGGNRCPAIGHGRRSRRPTRPRIRGDDVPAPPASQKPGRPRQRHHVIVERRGRDRRRGLRGRLGDGRDRRADDQGERQAEDRDRSNRAIATPRRRLASVSFAP